VVRAGGGLVQELQREVSLVNTREPSVDFQLRPGSEMTMRVKIGPVPIRWVAAISPSPEEGTRGFVDRQLKGPFAHWQHSHLFREAQNGSTLVDRVEYKLPLEPMSRWIAGAFSRKKVESMFAYRHRITAVDLQRAETPLPHRRVAISGASGMIGRGLAALLRTQGIEVIELVRRKAQGDHERQWSADGSLPLALEDCDAVVHLAGEPIAGGRWSRSRMDRIRTSRVEGTKVIADAVARATTARSERGEAAIDFLCASGAGAYGTQKQGDETPLDESKPYCTGFLAEVARDWEAAADAARKAGARTCHLRLGAVLSPAGGALRKMLPPFLFGGGGRIGSGKQWMSWIALDDALYAMRHILAHEELAGPINLVSPESITNAQFTKTLGRVLRRPTILPVHGFALRLAFGKMADEVLLEGQRAVPSKLAASGFKFEYGALEDALRHGFGHAMPR
ncbi:MAG: TIGR01777 family oxidoreductase, partial [Planctomycetota bacterium]